MTATGLTPADTGLADNDRPETPRGFAWNVRDSWTEALRHLRSMPRSPDILVFSTIQPIMFVLLFVYVFGGSLVVPGYDSYKQFVIPGIFAQTVLFGTSFTAVGVADDLSKGLVERLRSLPMYQPAFLIGRTISDLARGGFTFVVMMAVAFAIGFRFEGSLVDAVLATALLFAFSFAFSWVQAWIGMSVGSVEAANSAGFIWMFPLTFISSAFVDPSRMPGVLETVANVNPFSILTDATRAMYNGRDAGSDPWIALAWAVGITIVFATLATRKFSRTTSH